MTEAPRSDWSAAAIAFLAANLPRGGEGWEHMFSTPFQIGCEALVALGQATATERGAAPRAAPSPPDPLPRWDDVCVAILRLAEQGEALVYLPPQDGGEPSEGARPLAPEILPAHGLGPARAGAEAAGVLSALGLVDGAGRWTARAEPALWRVQPEAWALEVTADPRFRAAARDAAERPPPGLRARIDRLAAVTEAEIAAHIRRHVESMAEIAAAQGPRAGAGRPMSRARALLELHAQRRDALDWMFFRGWRWPEGWLTPDQAARALEVFHDPLAIQARRAVMARLRPDLPHLAQ